jgi:pimeloyl-ACP methyl ester carboxylesterase
LKRVTKRRVTTGIVLVSLVLGLGAAATAPLKKLRASGRAEVNGARLHYDVYGQGPALVFLHAGLADSRMWDPQVESFAGAHTVVRFDVRGYGESDPATAPYVPVDDLYLLLRFLEIDRACIVGLSMGGTFAIDFAAAHPEMVSPLVVVAGSPGWQPYSKELIARTSAIVAAGKEKGSTALVEGWLNDPMLAAAKARPAIARQMRSFLNQNAAGLFGTSFMRPPNIPTPKLSDFKMPTLVMVGDRDDPEIVERSSAMSREIPDAALTVIRGAGHMVNLEKPQEFNQALAAFLRRVK